MTSTLKQRIRNLEDLLWKGNYDNLIKDLKREIELLQGNLESEVKRRKALEEYLEITFETNYRYKKTKI